MALKELYLMQLPKGLSQMKLHLTLSEGRLLSGGSVAGTAAIIAYTKGEYKNDTPKIVGKGKKLAWI
jgi:hypothetical protein